MPALALLSVTFRYFPLLSVTFRYYPSTIPAHKNVRCEPLHFSDVLLYYSCFTAVLHLFYSCFTVVLHVFCSYLQVVLQLF